MIDENLDAYLEEHGTDCQVGNYPFRAIFNCADEELALSGFNAQTAQMSILMKTTDVVKAVIKNETIVIVKTIQYKARVPHCIDDGTFTEVPLTKL